MSPLRQTPRAAFSTTTNNSSPVSFSPSSGVDQHSGALVNQFKPVLVTTDSPERAPLYVLPAESHVDPVFQEGAKGHVLTQSPIQLTGPHQVGSAAQDTGDSWRSREEQTIEH